MLNMHHFSYSLNCHLFFFLLLYIYLFIYLIFFKLCAFMVCEQLEAIFFIIISQSCTRYVTLFSAKSSKYLTFHITAYVEIFAYVCVYCLCIGPCFYDILFVVFKILSSSLHLEAMYIIRHSISPIYCYHSDRDILNGHKTFTIDNMFIYTILNQTFSEMHESTIFETNISIR